MVDGYRRGFDAPSVVIRMESGDDKSRLEKFWRDEHGDWLLRLLRIPATNAGGLARITWMRSLVTRKVTRKGT